MTSKSINDFANGLLLNITRDEISRQHTKTWSPKYMRISLIIILAFVIQACLPVLTVHAASKDAHDKVFQAFVLVREADLAGGDVNPLVASLNEALDLIAQGDSLISTAPSSAQEFYQQAETIADQIMLEAPLVREKGIITQRNNSIMFGVELTILAAFGFIVYRYVPKMFWRLWLRTHRDWKVQA